MGMPESRIARARALLLAPSLLAWSVAAAASAQPDTRSNAPIDITANEAQVINSKCLAIWRGAAEALQGSTRLRADTITVYSRIKPASGSAPAGCDGTEKIVAEGSVYYVTPEQSVHGDRAVYTQGADQIVVTGNVVVAQGNDVARGDRLVINVASKEATMEASAAGAGGPNRVRGVFYPAKSAPAPASAAASH
ncbi:MAG TPA: LptA/OstA family protein [Caulobacteraceae bacterium]|nr:LptA/OstA family protein [Caulobacteraceae bacterium]